MKQKIGIIGHTDHGNTTQAQRDDTYNKTHTWDDQDRCIKCGDKDWFANSHCSENKIKPQ